MEEQELPLKLAQEFLNLRRKYATDSARADWDIFQEYLNEAIGVITQRLPSEER